jgi:hypothetical protein
MAKNKMPARYQIRVAYGIVFLSRIDKRDEFAIMVEGVWTELQNEAGTSTIFSVLLPS